MSGSAIAAAESRLARSRAVLNRRVHRVGMTLARPPALAGALAAGALVGYAVAGLRANTLASVLAGGLRHALARYVRQRTEGRGAPRQNARHG